jgi:uncharacterized small protein (DUF1192 family)
VNQKHCEIFESYAIAGQPVEKVAHEHGVTTENVYTIHSRLSRLLTEEVERMEAELERGTPAAKGKLGK